MMQGTRSTGTTNPPPFRSAETSSIEGLWVLLVQNDGDLPDQDGDGRVPVIAQTGNNQMFLLAFKNVAKARQFIGEAKLDGADARMVVRGNNAVASDAARGAGYCHRRTQ